MCSNPPFCEAGVRTQKNETEKKNETKTADTLLLPHTLENSNKYFVVQITIMLSLILGCSLPFAILLLIALASMVCADIVAADDVENSFAEHQGMENFPPSFEQPSQSFATSVNNRVHFSPPQRDVEHPLNKNIFTAATVDKKEIINHYVFPITSIAALRKRYGTSQNFWGDWSNRETRQFYRQQLPRALQSKFLCFPLVDADIDMLSSS